MMPAVKLLDNCILHTLPRSCLQISSRSLILELSFCVLGGSDSYAGAVVAAAVGVAALSFFNPQLEIYLFSRSLADKIEKTVRINESLQVCNTLALLSLRYASCQQAWQEVTARPFAHQGLTCNMHSNVDETLLEGRPTFEGCSRGIECNLQERGTEMLRLPGEDAIISWPNAKQTIIDVCDAYMARIVYAAATGAFSDKLGAPDSYVPAEVVHAVAHALLLATSSLKECHWQTKQLLDRYTPYAVATSDI